jgi:hypothetical protein
MFANTKKPSDTSKEKTEDIDSLTSMYIKIVLLRGTGQHNTLVIAERYGISQVGCRIEALERIE